MGSSIGRIDDQQQDLAIEENKITLKKLAAEIELTQPFGSDFMDRVWLEQNKDKILRNRRLIDLIG